MKQVIFVVSIFLYSNLSYANDSEMSVGLGVGFMYSGIGGNLAFVDDDSMKYISLGCVSYGSTDGARCGGGIGWITTDLFNFESNKHGFGIYAGIVGNEGYSSYSSSSDSTDIYRHNNTVYGAGVSYTFFTRGINKRGTTLGFSIHASNAEFDNKYGGFLQVGYQF